MELELADRHGKLVELTKQIPGLINAVFRTKHGEILVLFGGWEIIQFSLIPEIALSKRGLVPRRDRKTSPAERFLPI